jgi:RNA polymerase sigma-70 factor, ECF subfamily
MESGSQGNADAEAVMRVQALFLQHAGVIRGFIRALLPDRARADDVLQETFMLLTRKAADFDPATSFPKWACTVARYKVMEARRDMHRNTGVLSDEAIEALAASDEATSDDPRVERLRDCIDRLPPRLQELVKLRYDQDHLPGEIARRVSWTPEAVYVALSRARGLLRRCIESAPADPAS